jgi:hypothetical protein
MVLMARSSGFKGVLTLLTLLGLLWQAGCSRQVGVPSDDGAGQTTQTPFQDVGSASASSTSGDSSGTPDYLHGSPPFHDSLGLPAGTLLMVRLKTSISADEPGPNDSFEATMDEPVVMDGNTLIPRGADVIGLIESARASTLRPGRGYVQLVLLSVRVAGSDIAVQTASLFVRPSPQKGVSAHAIRLEKGHRLTFRLTQPLYAANHTVQIAR